MREWATETELIDGFGRRFGSAGRRRAEVFIGDDAAVLLGSRFAKRKLVWTVDTAVEGVHFRRRWLDAEALGARALHAAVSDVAAMGAEPVAALSSLVLPSRTASREVDALTRGQARAARSLGCPIVGGNVSRGRVLEITTSVLGHVERPLTRAGARAGDEVWILGALGLARAGLLALERGMARSRVMAPCVRAWRQPTARVGEGRRLAGCATACIDVSDGLGRDARALAAASRVRIVLDAALLETVLSPALRRACAKLGATPLDVAIVGGEDYALLATGPKRRRPRDAARIGAVSRGSGAWLESGGELVPLADGFDHLATGSRGASRRRATRP